MLLIILIVFSIVLTAIFAYIFIRYAIGIKLENFRYSLRHADEVDRLFFMFMIVALFALVFVALAATYNTFFVLET